MKVKTPHELSAKPDYCKMSVAEYNQGHNTRKPPLGSGERFAKLESKLKDKGASNPGALAAYIGRRKYGKAKFQKLAAKGKPGY